MPRFRVLITRDVTESTSVTVEVSTAEASDAEAAQTAAFAMLADSAETVWTLDEGSWNAGEIYVTSVDLAGN